MSKPIIVVTGANGQLGKEIRSLAYRYPAFDFLFLSKEELPVHDFESVRRYFETHKPAYCINCAAYTAVDKAEAEKDLAMLINGRAPGVLAAACREFEEETGIRPRGPFLPLGSIRQKAGKVVHAWAWKGDADAARVTSNSARSEWPPGSGRWITYPEVDRCAWFDPAAARVRINPAQAELIGRLEEAVGGRRDVSSEG